MTFKISKYSALLGTLLMSFALILLVGCEGNSGRRGDIGGQGPDGPDYQDPTPANRFFSLAVTNNSFSSHNGAPKLYLSFDTEHSASGDTVVSTRRTSDDPIPNVDGLDGGVDEWGNVATTVQLVKAAGTYNFIESATVKSLFDEEFIYFQVKWTEVANAEYGLEVGANDRPAYLRYPADSTVYPTVWDYEAGHEDRLLMLFEITPVTRYATDGCLVTCHTTEDRIETNHHATRSGREYMDVWTWGAGLTDPTGYGRDQYMTSSPNNNIIDDNGIPVIISNQIFAEAKSSVAYVVTRRQPKYESINDPNANTSYPFWTWNLAGVKTIGWTAGSQIPAYISIPNPTNSAGDLEAKGKFDSDTGTWTVELKRARRNGNGDDAQF